MQQGRIDKEDAIELVEQYHRFAQIFAGMVDDLETWMRSRKLRSQLIQTVAIRRRPKEVQLHRRRSDPREPYCGRSPPPTRPTVTCARCSNRSNRAPRQDAAAAGRAAVARLNRAPCGRLPSSLENPATPRRTAPPIDRSYHRCRSIRCRTAGASRALYARRRSPYKSRLGSERR